MVSFSLCYRVVGNKAYLLGGTNSENSSRGLEGLHVLDTGTLTGSCDTDDAIM